MDLCMTDPVASTNLVNSNSVGTLRDERIPVCRPEIFPSRTVGQILVRLKDGQLSQGTGSLLSDYTVLTAGHMVKSHDNRWLDIEWMRFIPARNHASEPYGRFDWAEMRAVCHGARDWALVSLRRPAGFSTGFLGSHARLPISRWVGVGDLSHVGFPLDHADEMWIDVDGRCTRINQLRQLRTNLDAAAGQSGGPLTIRWFDSNPQVIGSLVEGPNPVENPNDFMPGWEFSKDDTWMRWLRTYFSTKHADDRFCEGALSSAPGADQADNAAMMPRYTGDSVFASDTGPVIRIRRQSDRDLNAP